MGRNGETYVHVRYMLHIYIYIYTKYPWLEYIMESGIWNAIWLRLCYKVTGYRELGSSLRRSDNNSNRWLLFLTFASFSISGLSQVPEQEYSPPFCAPHSFTGPGKSWHVLIAFPPFLSPFPIVLPCNMYQRRPCYLSSIVGGTLYMYLNIFMYHRPSREVGLHIHQP